MMDFFKRGSEFNKLANSFGEIYIGIEKLERLFNLPEPELIRLKDKYKFEIFRLAYIANKEIINRMDQYGWELGNMLIVNKISTNKITIQYAWSLTITKLHMLIGLLQLQNEYEEIRNNGPICQVIESYIENEIKINKYFGH